MNMQQPTTFLNKQATRTSVPFENGIQARIASLKEERERLEEEIRQLRVAVQIYTEVARRRALAANGESKNIPLYAA